MKRPSSEIAPAISTPVGPPPMTTLVSSARASSGSEVASARSKAKAGAGGSAGPSRMVLRPGAAPATRHGRNNCISSRWRARCNHSDRLAVSQQPRFAVVSTPTTSPSEPAHSCIFRAICGSVRRCRRRQRRRRHLIEQRLEEIVIAAIDHHHVERRPGPWRGRRRGRRSPHRRSPPPAIRRRRRQIGVAGGEAGVGSGGLQHGV